MHCVRDFLMKSGLARLDAQVLLQHVLGVSRSWLIAHDTDVLSPAQLQAIEACFQRRQAGEPVAYIVGEREFMGHVFKVSPAVLIPRPDTELLVETALQVLRARPGEAQAMLDLGTGSGAIAISVALACSGVQVVATDASEPALRLARENAQNLGARVEFYAGNWYHALLGSSRFDLIVSNPPYIAPDDSHMVQGDLRFEPRGALTDETDGLQAIRQIVQEAPEWLKPGGVLWLEHGWDQAASVRALLEQSGFQDVQSRKDLAQIERISGGRYNACF
ncbi:MAG: protein-(glutamine-N5) methyltransferase, release factor-specific [Pusillimonas sp.]|nr:protein-(glutamine-N5) methyltransferase, release factor-specific [Pusillimonas sp.]MBC41457.1 protein-(glutamine-N5) methyltransferase, release factor-specific [Pusillimonas sp.]HCP77341.1 peptide chain release factor N(5)-glutamine methyltransferase [Pusillimonas sp.]|tara:strand:+ start:2785 stop:3615 length:831 start_codon:yes stop_codon:yes gene_type:complete